MTAAKPTIENIDQYIAGFDAPVQAILQQVRQAIHKAAPAATEVISYKMPAFSHHGVLVYFAAYKKHIGFYPTASGIREFAHEFTDYTWSKGAVQFPLHQPMPLKLITRITKFRFNENMEKAALKAAKTKK